MIATINFCICFFLCRSFSQNTATTYILKGFLWLPIQMRLRNSLWRLNCGLFDWTLYWFHFSLKYESSVFFMMEIWGFFKLLGKIREIFNDFWKVVKTVKLFDKIKICKFSHLNYLKISFLWAYFLNVNFSLKFYVKCLKFWK